MSRAEGRGKPRGETLAAALFVNLADDMLADHVGEAAAVKLFALTPRQAPPRQAP